MNSRIDTSLCPSRIARTGTFARLRAAALVLCLAVAGGSHAHADTTTLAILHPDLESASGAMFRQMLVGIARFKGATVVATNMGANPDPGALSRWSDQQRPTALILLGSQGGRIAVALDSATPKFIAGTVRPPAGLAGVSMLGEPAQFFAQLKQLTPTIRNVSIVNSPEINGWWIEPASADASKAGLKLRSLVADDVVTSARVYRDFLARANPQTDALWIPLTDIAPIKTVLPLILRESWSRNIVVFAHNPLLVKQGVLFALYPDNEDMGYQVAEMASSAKGRASPRVVHAKKLLTAINRRTAAHLGIDVSEQQLQHFDRIYPVQ